MKTIKIREARGRDAREKAQLLRKQMHQVRKQHIVCIPCGMQIVVSSAALGDCSSFCICVCPSHLNPCLQTFIWAGLIFGLSVQGTGSYSAGDLPKVTRQGYCHWGHLLQGTCNSSDRGGFQAEKDEAELGAQARHLAIPWPSCTVCMSYVGISVPH